ncbi:MAG: beta-ribofuranosylaminobenzene 5'-phosphate synthase [Candidatus Bathyarchaeota archaeon]|nr:beta-ribofuranosylaminobenzene 5'-phosphate synthase [Candidatus Bathyarchaeota archaeon]
MRVSVKTPSRLHFSLIDMNGSLNRINGSIGLALNFPNYELEVTPSKELEVHGEQTELFEKAAIIFYNHFNLKEKVTIKILKTIPRHVGLGSTTQGYLGIGSALSRLHKIELSTRQLAEIMGRGGTSGIGTAAFQTGGFILDGGHSLKTIKRENIFVPSSISKLPPPPILMRYKFPTNWKFVIAIPNIQKGLHGRKEVRIFEERCPIPPQEVGEMCRLILMKILPAILEEDIEDFGSGISALEELGFAKSTSDLMHSTTKACIKLMKNNGAYGVGQSSFGPTTYGIVEGVTEARKLSTTIRSYLEDEFNGGEVFYSEANNKGHELEIDE